MFCSLSVREFEPKILIKGEHLTNFDENKLFDRKLFFFLMKKGRGVARDKSMYRHHYSRGVQGHAPSEIVDILYHRSCILEHFKAYFEEFLLYIVQRLQRRYTYRSIYSFLNVNSSHKSRR